MEIILSRRMLNNIKSVDIEMRPLWASEGGAPTTQIFLSHLKTYRA